eukprot:sb/3473885/
MCLYRGRTVSFLKRAQILVSDIWTCLDGKGLGEFHNIDQLTMFADYRVPQALVALNVLTYSDELKAMLKGREPVEPGSEVECEIRGMSIIACDMICEMVQWLGRERGVEVQVSAPVVDYCIWLWARKNRDLIEELPFHRTRTIYY